MEAEDIVQLEPLPPRDRFLLLRIEADEGRGRVTGDSEDRKSHEFASQTAAYVARCHLRRFGFLWRLHRWEEAGWGCMRCRDCGAMR